MVTSVRSEWRKHPDAAVIDDLFTEAQRTPLWGSSQRKLQVQVPVADVDEAILDRDVYTVGRGSEVIQIALAVLA